jgi:hypothetical protein
MIPSSDVQLLLLNIFRVQARAHPICAAAQFLTVRHSFSALAITPPSHRPRGSVEFCRSNIDGPFYPGGVQDVRIKPSSWQLIPRPDCRNSPPLLGHDRAWKTCYKSYCRSGLIPSRFSSPWPFDLHLHLDSDFSGSSLSPPARHPLLICSPSIPREPWQ